MWTDGRTNDGRQIIIKSSFLAFGSGELKSPFCEDVVWAWNN